MDLQKGLRAADATFEKFFDSHVYRDGINAVLTDEAIKAVDPAKAAFMCNCNYRQNQLNVIPFLVYGEEGVKEELFADCIGPITSQELRRILNILSTGQAHE